MKRVLLFIMLIVLVATTNQAHDFSVTQNGNTIYFKITDTKAHTACLTYKGSIADHNPLNCTGTVTIPSTVKHGGVVYTITAVGPKAMAGAKNLEGIVMPVSIQQIGDFAFEGCTSLKSVVMPEAQPKLGQGTFFGCTAVSDITLGNNWTAVDFTMFRWSDSLQTISIPAKVERIKGLKTLRRLRSIDVNTANKTYKSHDGCLYSTTSNTLLCVPRAFAGVLNVVDGTTDIMWGSIIDCAYITSVTLPASLLHMSFREFSRMQQLQYLTILAEAPLYTANYEGRDTTALVVANSEVILFVPKPAVKAWRKSIIAIDGEYCDIVANRPQSVDLQDAVKTHKITQSQMLKSNQVKAIKSK